MVTDGNNGYVCGVAENVTKCGGHREVRVGVCAVAWNDEDGTARSGGDGRGGGEEERVDGFDGGNVERRGRSYSSGKRSCYGRAEGGF